MVVQFPPAGEHDASIARGARKQKGAASRDGIAPVTYLPGAQPSEAAQQAMARVQTVAQDGEESASGARGRASSSGANRADRDRSATRAGNVAIHQLARRGMSRWELEQVLAKREVDEQTAAAELDRLESIGLVDDASLAVSLVYAMHTRKGSGRAAIEQELRRRHLAQEVIEEALAELDGDDELERALELATARARQLTNVDYDVAVRRLSGYLARKGYDGETVRAAVRTALNGHPRGSAGAGGTVRFR